MVYGFVRMFLGMIRAIFRIFMEKNGSFWREMVGLENQNIQKRRRVVGPFCGRDNPPPFKVL